MNGAANCQHSITDSFCALAEIVVIFRNLGVGAVVAAGEVARKKSWKWKRRKRRAKGMVSGRIIEMRAKFLIVALNATSMQGRWEIR